MYYILIVSLLYGYSGCVCRAFQMLQDCHLLSPPGIQNDELIPRYDAILRSLSSWSTKEDVILHAFEFLSMVADRDIMKKRSVSTDDGQLIYFINKAIAYHHSSIPLQRASLQLFEAIIENIQEKKHLKYIATTIFKSVLDNLLLKNNDVAICHSSFSIMLSLADHASELIRPWTDQLINLSIGSVMKHHSPEVTSKCILLMDKLTQDSEALLTIVRHSCGLMFFPDALQYLRASHIFAATVCLELFLHILEDFDVATIAFQNTRGLHPIDYAIRLRAILKDRFEKYLGLTVDLDQKDEELLQFLFLLHTHIDELIDEMLQPPEPGYTRSEAPRRPAMIESLAVEDNNQFEHAPDQLNSDFAASVQVVSSDSTLDGVEVVVVEAENDLDQQLKLVHSAEQSKDSSENTETIPDEEQDMIEITEQDDIEELSLPKEISTIEVRQQQDINVEVVESQEVIQQEVKIAEEIIQEEESIRDTVSEEVIAVPDDLEASAEVHFEVKEVEKETEHHGEDVPAAEPNAVVATEQEVQTVIKSNDVITSKEKEIREDLKLDLPKVSTEITPPPGMMASPAPMDQRTEATINGSLSIGSGSVGSASFDAPFSHRAGQRVIRLATFNPHASSSLPLRPSVATNSGHLSARSNTSDTPPYIGIAVEKSTDNPIVPSGKKLVDVKYLDELVSKTLLL